MTAFRFANFPKMTQVSFGSYKYERMYVCSSFFSDVSSNSPSFFEACSVSNGVQNKKYVTP